MYFLAHISASFLRRNDQKKDQNRTKNKISPSFFSHRPVGFCARCFFDERNFANLFRLLFFEHTNAGRKVLLATGARRMLRRQSAHRCTPGTFRRSMRAFDGVERAVFWGRIPRDATMRMLRFFGSFFGRVFSPFGRRQNHFGRERRKKKIGIRSEKDPRERDTSAPS